ncbi:MAG: hypothetical protein ACRD03_08695 [Acidimicrobiales bacterium]
MTVALIDDEVLGAVLRGERPAVLAGHDLATTGCWYVRLCQAVLSASERTGVLSRPFEGLPEAHRRRAFDALVELPSHIELLSLRHLGPAIGRLRERHSLNLLAGEAVAAANHLGADVVLSAPAPRLEEALAAEGRPWARLA